MAKTSTGSFPIGFRRGWSDWQKDLSALSTWAKQQTFEAIDLGKVSPADVQTLKSANLRLGSVDLLDFGNLMNSDAAKRKDLIAQNVAYVKEASSLGAKAFFTCIIPGNKDAPRAENYKLAIESFAPIAQTCAQVNATMVIEGWPGGAPQLANLCCTPETVRAFLKDVGSGAGVNYDPSHLIRLGVDHLKFLEEFLPHIKHVHAKDTLLYPEASYEFGTQPAAFGKPHGFGEWTWRYTIPGAGVANWRQILSTLKAHAYNGIVSVELEDEDFNGSEDGEKRGLRASLDFLKTV